MPRRIDKLTPAQKARFEEWADRWIEIGLRTGPADRPRFETAVRDCYRFAGLKAPKTIVWVSSPFVMALAAPIASYLLARRAGRSGAVEDAVEDAVGDAVRDAVGGAVSGAVRGAVGGAVRQDIAAAISNAWHRYLGGQFWVGGWWDGGAWTSFFREVCNLELVGDLWDRARAYEATMESACWWWPHRDFVMVSERPLEIHRELVNPARARGCGSHRLHNESGPAVVWPDGWGVYAIHGLRVPRAVVMDPDSLDPKEIIAERNAEIRRVMVERYTPERFIRNSGARLIHKDDWGELYQQDLVDDEPVTVVHVVNSTPEPDGSYHNHWLRVPPTTRTAHEAVAWTTYRTAATYQPLVQT